ncbi:MAG: reverse transcriptase N-terminal domain-containing protein, partial [Trichodesmium sp. St18_bin1]|nr:reverse transcriptase N-terminal domain-containing protein [Trichodesmium sp. St18_bin1]
KGRDIDWRRALKNVFKLQKLIYRASNCGEIRKMRKYQKLLTKSYYPRLLAVRFVTQVDPGKKTTGVNRIKSFPPMQRFNQVELLNTGYLKASPNDGNWTSWSRGIGKHPGVRKEVTIE